MEISIAKDETVDEDLDNIQEIIKIEQGQEIHTIILQNVSEQINDENYDETSEGVDDEFVVDSDGHMEIGQVMLGDEDSEQSTYTYVAENNDEYDEGATYEIHETEDGQQYIIEKYTEFTDETQFDADEIFQIDEDLDTTPINEELVPELRSDSPQETITISNVSDDTNTADADESPPFSETLSQQYCEDSSDSAVVKFEVAADLTKNCFECNICEKVLPTQVGLKRHIAVCHQAEPGQQDELTFQLCVCCGEPSDTAHTIGDIKCDLCDKLFLEKNCLARHMSIDHPPSDSYSCVECHKSFPDRDSLVEHMRVHPLKYVKCAGCGATFTRKYHLVRHLAQKGCTGVPRDAYECRVCHKFFTRKDNLADHLRSHAGMVKKKKKLLCTYCEKEFHSVTMLKVHVRTHTGEKPYPCDVCYKRFPTSGALKKHGRMHTGEKPYGCDQCDKRFAAKETLNRHMRIHTGDKPHVCKFCGKSFIQPTQLRAHIFHHTGENAFVCTHCGRAFNRRLRLTTHIKYVHEGQPPLNCPEKGCTKTFFRKEDVARHMLSHNGEKHFGCDECGKRFVVSASLRIHQLTHRKEQPVTCDTCGRAFIRQDCLMRHMRMKHRDVLEDIMLNAEKKRLQAQLLSIINNVSNKSDIEENIVWNELTLTESVRELVTLLVDDECLRDLGHPDTPVEKVLGAVIRRCGHKPASEDDLDYIGRMRENARLLFTVVIDDEAVKELLNNQSIDDVIMHVLRLAKKQD